MKIHELNSQGTIGVVIPKDIAEMLGWESGQDVLVTTTDDDTVIKLTNKTLRSKE